MTQSQDYKYTNIDLVKFLYINFKIIVIITIIGVIISILVSFLITPKFKSAVIIYPASTSSISKALLTDMTMTPKDVMKFGEEEETEQLMQILLSDEIKARIIQKHDLVKHYNIDPNSKYYKTQLLLEYDDNISFRKTEFQAIEIKVLDTDPEFAAAIANDITALLDSVYNKIQKERALKALALVQKVYNDQVITVQQLEDSLSAIGEKGVYDYASQSKSMSDAYAVALSSRNMANANLIKQKLENLAKYGSTFNSLIKQHEDEIKQLDFLKTKLAEAKVDAYNDLPHKYIVNPAQVSERKSYPVRWLIVVFSTISTFVFIVFFLLLFERFKGIRKELLK
jgi:LPS O-antigen subunit length determinant protein (WzzB/FepE family)